MAKADGDERFCIDFRGINIDTVMSAWPLPDVANNLSRIKGSWFAIFDLLSGFHQLELASTSAKYSAFHNPLGVLCWARMPFGLKGAPATFAKVVQRVLEGLPPSLCLSYVDDLIVAADTLGELLEKTDAVLTRLGQANLLLKPKKVFWGFPEVPYLGFLVNKRGHRPDPEKTRCIREWSICNFHSDPRSQIPRWLGLIGVYQSFIPNFSRLCGVFWDAVAKGANTKDVVNTLRFTVCFHYLRHLLATCTENSTPDFTLPFHVATDASRSGGGAVLFQLADQDGSTPRPLAFFSTRFDGPLRGRGSRVQECYMVRESLVKWRHYLRYSIQTIAHTDHESLKWLLRTNHSNDEMNDWANDISLYVAEGDIRWRPSAENQVADAISHMYDYIRFTPRLLQAIENEDRTQTSSVTPGDTVLVTGFAPCVPRLSTLVTTSSTLDAAALLSAPGVHEIDHQTPPTPAFDPGPAIDLMTDEAQSSLATGLDPGSDTVTDHLTSKPSTSLATTAKGKRAALVLVHPSDGVLTVTESDSRHFFPGGPLTLPGAQYRAEAAQHLLTMGGAEAQPLADYVLARAPTAKLSLRDTTYLMYAVATTAAAASLSTVTGVDRYCFHVTAFGQFKDVAFVSQSDIQCASKLRDALNGNGSLLQLSAFEPASLLAVIQRLHLSLPPDSLGVRLSDLPQGPLLIDNMSTYEEWTGLVSNALEHPDHPRVMALDTEYRGRMLQLVQVHFDAHPDGGPPFTMALDVLLLPRGLRKGGPLAEWLTDTTIVKVAHNCWGDADLLFANFGLAVLPIWDKLQHSASVLGVECHDAGCLLYTSPSPRD